MLGNATCLIPYHLKKLPPLFLPKKHFKAAMFQVFSFQSPLPSTGWSPLPTRLRITASFPSQIKLFPNPNMEASITQRAIKIGRKEQIQLEKDSTRYNNGSAADQELDGNCPKFLGLSNYRAVALPILLQYSFHISPNISLHISPHISPNISTFNYGPGDSGPNQYCLTFQQLSSSTRK